MRGPGPFWRMAGMVTLAVVASLLVLMVWFEEKLIYFPSRELQTTPSELSLESEEIFLEAEDGVRLHAWFLPAPNGEASRERGVTVLYCHGNAGNLADRLDRAASMHRELGADVLLFDYRGYGLSEGSPDEAGTYRDGRAAYRYLVSERGIPPGRIVLYGESLGAAVALQLALEAGEDARALVLEAPFTSIAEMARTVYPWLPVSSLLRTRYENLAKISEIELPLLVIHGTSDPTVPFEQGRRLYEAAPEPKRFLGVEGAGHVDASDVATERYWNAWRELSFKER